MQKIVSTYLGDAPRLFSLGHVRAQQSMLPLFDTQHRAPVRRVYRLKMRRMRSPTGLGDQHLEVGVIAAKLGDEALGSLAFAVIVLAAILFDQRRGHARNDCARVGVDEGRPQQLMSLGDGAVAVGCCQTRRAGHLWGGTRAGAIESYAGMARDQDPLFKGFATLQVTTHQLERWSHVCGCDRGEDLAH